MRILKPKANLPDYAEAILKDLYCRLGLPQRATRLKLEVLSPREVILLESRGLPAEALPIDVASATLSIVARQRGITLERALLDLSRDLDMVSTGRYESMRRAIGEPVGAYAISVPVWDAASGELRFNGEVARRISGRARNLRLLLDSFEEQNWRPRIDSPFPRAVVSRQLRDTLETLNDGLRLIIFRGDGSGSGVEWRACPQHRRNTGA